MKRKINIGDHVVRWDGFGFYELTVIDRTLLTIRTAAPNGTIMDVKGRLDGFRFIDDPEKVKLINRINNQIRELENERRSTLNSMPEIE